MLFLHLAVKIDVKYSRHWGALCTFLPAITSAHLRETPLMRPKFHQHLICREIPIEAADVAIIDGAWVYGMVRAANFPLGRETSIYFLPLDSGFL